MNIKRPPELIRHKLTWLTKESYRMLRKQKTIQKKSITRIVDNLIKEKYGK